MTVAEREACTVMAALLHAHRTLAVVALLMTVAMAGAAVAASLSGLAIRTPALIVGAVSLTLGAIERYFAFRIRLDERIFAALGDGAFASLAGVDDALLRVSLIDTNRPARTLDERLKGAVRLCWQHRTLVAAQLVCMIGFAVLQTF